MPETAILFERLAIALALGFLIGMERGWKTRSLESGERVAGVRTFTVIGFLGGLSAVLTLTTGPTTLAAALVAAGAMLVVNHWHALKSQADVGTTTLMAALATFALGAVAGFGELAVAAAGAVVIAIVLGVKQQLHSFVARLEHHELMSGLQLLAISVVLLPVLPNADYGPLDAINPYEIWWMVVLIAGLSFLGYIAIRIAGSAHGVMLTGLIGGFASSTVIALNMSRLSRTNNHKNGQSDSRDGLLAAGANAALATMYPRVVVIVAAISLPTAIAVAWALIPACLATLATVAWHWRKAAAHIADSDDLLPRKPFELRVALEFAVILTIIMVAVEAVRTWMGDSGLYALALVAGLFDVDAITLSYAQMAGDGSVLPTVIAIGICLGTLANMIAKPMLVSLVGAPRMALHMLPVLALAVGAGVLGLIVGDLVGGHDLALGRIWAAS